MGSEVIGGEGGVSRKTRKLVLHTLFSNGKYGHGVSLFLPQPGSED